MPPHETESFTTFVTKLSRNPKVPQRLLATELAVAMLDNLPGPFLPPNAASTPGNSGGDGGTPTTGTPVSGRPTDRMLPPQPWGVRCTAVLIQRASDKAPSIRAKAMLGLSTSMRDAPAPLIALARGEVSANAVISAGMMNHGGALREGARTPGSGLRAAVLGRNARTPRGKTPRGASAGVPASMDADSSFDVGSPNPVGLYTLNPLDP
jgi:hypothetical protein